MDKDDVFESIGRKDIKFIQGDQWEDISLLLNKRYDIIVDDASHRDSDIQYTFGLLFPKLKSGGVYAIEDLDAKRSTPPGRPICPKTRALFQNLSEFTSPVLTKQQCKYISENIKKVKIIGRLCIIVKV